MNHTRPKNLYLGCPVWACADWKGTLFKKKASRKDFLPQYSSVFNTVEVNSTFYALPSVETVQRWCDETTDGFQFCLKFPRTITHDAQLIDCERETEAFLSLMRILKDAGRLGPAFLQLPPFFSGRQFPALEAFLPRLPKDFFWSVEVRHMDYFDKSQTEEALNQLLKEHGIDRCLFDSRALFSAPPSDPVEEVSQRRKPKSPFRATVTGSRPMVRLVGRNNVGMVSNWWEEWAAIVSDWQTQGLTPYVFTHAPNDLFAPDLAEDFWSRMRERNNQLPAMPKWPGRAEVITRQKTLF